MPSTGDAWNACNHLWPPYDVGYVTLCARMVPPTDIVCMCLKEREPFGEGGGGEGGCVCVLCPLDIPCKHVCLYMQE